MREIVFDQLQETLYYERLPNGLDVFLLPKNGFRKTYATLTTRYGSVDNDFQPPGGERVQVPDGIAHFLEHKMFEQENGDVFDDFAKNGASANAFTSFNRTAYLFSCTDRIEENVTTLLNFVQDPYFTEENVTKEKGIIGQEIRMYDDNPDWRVYFGLIEAMFKRHPVRIDIAGTVESIAKITKDTLYTCYKTFYHPSNMVLFIVGGIDQQRLIRLIRENQQAKSFADAGEIKRFYPEEPPGVSEKVKDVQLHVGLSKCLMGFKESRLELKGRDYLAQEYATQIALEAVLGQSSDLYQTLYDEGLINEQFGFDYTLAYDYGFSLFGGDTKNPDALIDRVTQALPEYCAKGIPEAQFERLRKKKLGEFLRHLNSPEFIANQFTRYHFNEVELFQSIAVLESLTREDVNRRLSEHMAMDRFAASIVRPLDKRASH